MIYVIQEKLNAIDSTIAPIVSMLGSHVNAFVPDELRGQSSHQGMHTPNVSIGPLFFYFLRFFLLVSSFLCSF